MVCEFGVLLAAVLAYCDSVAFNCVEISRFIVDISRSRPLGRLKFLSGVIEHLRNGLPLADAIQDIADLPHLGDGLEFGDDPGPLAVGHAGQELDHDVDVAFGQYLRE